MITKTMTSRWLSTALLLVLVSSLSVTALPCVCAGTCASEATQPDGDASGAKVSVAGSQSCTTVQTVSKSSEASGASTVSSTCDCDVTSAPELIRHEHQRPNTLTDDLDGPVQSVVNRLSFDQRTDGFTRQIRIPHQDTSVPSYIRHASLLL